MGSRKRIIRIVGATSLGLKSRPSLWSRCAGLLESAEGAREFDQTLSKKRLELFM